MTGTMTIGDFSRATRLSAKTLRFYHEEKLLEPVRVDPANGYRIYSAGQIADAEVIRRFRSLDMPIDLIRAVLTAATVQQRDELIAGHLAAMEAQLVQTRAAVASLRELLVHPTPGIEVVHRRIDPALAAVIRADIDLADLGSWYTEAKRELTELSDGIDSIAAVPLGGIWSTELFLNEHGAVAMFLPVAPGTADNLGGRMRVEQLPAVDLVVTTHRGPDEEMGQTYAALGDHVARHETSADGALWEFYLREPGADGTGAVTEVGWPILRSAK